MFLFMPSLKAQNYIDRYVKTIKPQIFETHLKILTSDSCSGRAIGTNGISIAQTYIVNQFKESPSLKPYINGNWLQSFPLVCSGSKVTHINTNGIDLENFKDYKYVGLYDGLNAEFPVVFTGNGTDEDYKNLDVKGKAVLSFNNNLDAALKNAEIAVKYGAKFTIIANPKNQSQFESIIKQTRDNFNGINYRSPSDTLHNWILSKLFDKRYIIISSEGIKKLTSYNINHWKKSCNEKTGTIATLRIVVEKQHIDTVTADNIVGFITGTNPKESIIIGAHYDHLGINGDKIYYGADDNASGVAALILLAKVFGEAYKDGYKPEKNIVFIAFSAEEPGLFGSSYFVEHLEHNNEIKLMINLDMIGRSDTQHTDNDGYFYYIGKNLADTFYTQNRMLCKKYNLTPDYTSNEDASDQKSFSAIGIPTIFYFDGKNLDLHKPTDTADKIDYYRIQKMTKMIFETIWLNAGVKKPEIILGIK